MRTLFSLAVVLVALAGSRAAEKISAPVPKEQPQPTIDGKYMAISVSTPADRAAPVNGPNGPGGGFGRGGGGRWAGQTSSNLLGPVVITKNEMIFEGRGNNWDPFTGQPMVPTAALELTYILDTTKTPMTIDVQTTSLRGKKTTSLGLVEVNGDRLVIAIAKEGDERPKNTEENGDVTVYYLRKAAPAPIPKVEFRIVAMTVGKEAEAEKELNKLTEAGYELVSTNPPVAPDSKSAPTTIHFILKRTAKP